MVRLITAPTLTDYSLTTIHNRHDTLHDTGMNFNRLQFNHNSQRIITGLNERRTLTDYSLTTIHNTNWYEVTGFATLTDYSLTTIHNVDGRDSFTSSGMTLTDYSLTTIHNRYDTGMIQV